MKFIPLLMLLSVAASAQTPAAPPGVQVGTAQLSASDANQLCARMVQLMDAGGVAIPDLQRASAPVIENVRAACTQLQLRANAGQPTYALLMNLRAYLTLADAVPKPFPFPEAARQQLTELRDESTRLEAHLLALLDQKDSQLRSSDRDNLGRYAEANRKLAPPQAGKPRVIFFGDSITDLWRLNEYFSDRDFVNRGISGQITGEMLGRMKADVVNLQPAAALILAGTNDLARNIPLVTIEENYSMLATLASANNIKVIFASVLPVSDYHKDRNPAYEMTKVRPPVYIKALNEWLQNFCAQKGCTYLNYYQALVDDQGQLGTDLADDGLHPNAKGYRVMAPLALAAVDKTLGTQQPLISAKPKKRRDASK
jgi:lysophospholipase L1-like esterase